MTTTNQGENDMSIRIIAQGDRLYKREELTGLEVEIHGDEKAFYAKELAKIDQGTGDGQRIGNTHRDYCECEECMTGTAPDDVEEGIDIDWPPNGPRS